MTVLSHLFRKVWYFALGVFVATLLVVTLGCSEPGRENEQRGDKMSERKDHRAAIASYSIAIQKAPDIGRYYAKRGEMYLAIKEYENALTDFDRYKKLAGADAKALLSRATVLLRLGRYDDATQQLTDCIASDPSADNYRLRGEAFLETLQAERAVDDFDQVLRRSPDDATVLVLRGRAYLRLKKNGEAESDLTRAIEIDSNLASAYWNRAKARTRMGKADLANQDRAKSISLDPSLDFSNSELGRDVVRDLGLSRDGTDLLLDVLK